MSLGGPLRTSFDEGLARITLARPDSNAIDLALASALRDAVSELPDDARVMLLDADGANFCLGGDLKSFADEGETIESYIPELTRVLHEATVMLHDLVPTVASVQGNVAGAGIGLMAACDVAIASPQARFTFAYPKVGLTPDASVSYMLPRLIGRAKSN